MGAIRNPWNGYLKPTLKRLGLYHPLRELLRSVGRHRQIQRYTATLRGTTVQFSTEDDYSNSWFFPRYARGRIHERQVTEHLLDALSGATCFVDVGTHLGWYTCWASKRMPHGTVYGFEMDELNFRLLTRNLELNDCRNAEVHNMAVSDTSGIVRYKRTADHPSSTFAFDAGMPAAGDGANAVTVRSVALDEFLETRGARPDVVKIDVEGAEMNVLMGMKRTIERAKPVLFVEIHPTALPRYGTSTRAILALLTDLGYRVFEIEGLRRQSAESALRSLRADSPIERNTMLYAT